MNGFFQFSSQTVKSNEKVTIWFRKETPYQIRLNKNKGQLEHFIPSKMNCCD